MKDQKFAGIIISYVTMMLQIIINFGFTPFLIKSLGTNEYGLYQTINSFADTLLIVNFGIAVVMSRNVIKYRLEDDKKKLENFLCIGLFITIFTSMLMLFVGWGASTFIEVLFQSALTSEELMKAKYMFAYLVLNIAIVVWNNMFSGIAVGHEQFIFTNGLKLFRQILRVVILTVLLLLGKDSVAIVATDLFITIILLTIEVIFCFRTLKIKIKFHYFDKTLIISTCTFALASLLQTIINQINFNIDKVILGATTSTGDVAKYSIALLIFSTMVSITKVIGSVYLPEATKLVIGKATGEDLTDLVIRAGRIQNIIGNGIFFSFLIMGNNFLGVWVGNEFTEVWLSTIILILPIMFTCVTSVANTILDAMMRKMARSLILLVSAVMNIMITLVLVRYWGYLGAAIGTSISIIIGEIVLLNVYYGKVIKINILRMYREIFKGIFPCALIATAITMLVSTFTGNTFMSFIVKAVTFVIVYGFTLFKYGLDNREKKFILSKIEKLR